MPDGRNSNNSNLRYRIEDVYTPTAIIAQRQASEVKVHTRLERDCICPHPNIPNVCGRPGFLQGNHALRFSVHVL
jgi:hypothetical protein